MKLEDLEQFVGVHVGNPLLQLRPEFSPPSNYVGEDLLHRMLELALLSDGLTGEACCGLKGVELNDCVFMAAVTDRLAAVETLKRELKPLSLLPHCQIGFLEDGKWHCLYPSPNVRLNWLMDGERVELATLDYFQAQSEWLKLLRRIAEQMRPDGGQPGGGGAEKSGQPKDAPPSQ